ARCLHACSAPRTVGDRWGSAVTRGAVRGGLDALLTHDFGPDFARRTVGRPVHGGHEVRRAQVRRGIAVTLEAPTHGERSLLPHALHRVDAPVAADAGDAARDVRAVVEVHVVG